MYAPLPPASSYGHRAELWGVVSPILSHFIRHIKNPIICCLAYLRHANLILLFLSSKDQEKWLKEVVTKLVAIGDNLFVRLEDTESGQDHLA